MRMLLRVLYLWLGIAAIGCGWFLLCEWLFRVVRNVLS